MLFILMIEIHAVGLKNYPKHIRHKVCVCVCNARTLGKSGSISILNAESLVNWQLNVEYGWR